MANRDTIAALQAQMDLITGAGAVTSGSGAGKAAAKRKRKKNVSLAYDCDDGECGLSDDDRASDAGNPEKAFKKIIALVNVSDRSERSVRERLARAGFNESAIDTAVARAVDCGFIDDIRYGEVLVRSRVSQGKGSAGIERELAEQGIDPCDVPGWPYDFSISAEEELDRALGVLRRNPPRSKNAREAAYRKLMQKGYPSSIAATAARTWYESTR